MKKKKIIFLIVGIGLAIILTIILVSKLEKAVRYSFEHGETHEGLAILTANKLLDSTKAALQSFHRDHGHYPMVDGRKFFDSIKPYIHTVYVYIDSTHPNGKPIALPAEIIGIDWKKTDKAYLAYGWDSPLIYKQPTKNHPGYILYWMGLNGKDEGGKGDDVVRTPE